MPPLPQDTEQLKFVIVGHVDHGKSTLIGRLLYDTHSLPASKMEEIRKASEDLGYDVEFSYVMDHLEEERSNRITIDTARIWFRREDREYVIIDAPGHREFLRNMITGASYADAAVFLLDAAEGIREQSRRHAYVLGMLGIRQIIVLVNKMDLVGWSKARYDELCADLGRLFEALKLRPLMMIPVSAKLGDNIASSGGNLPWYDGPTVLASLGQLKAKSAPDAQPLRLPLQDRYTVEGRDILVGQVAAGRVSAGQDVACVPSGLRARVETVEMFGQSRRDAQAGESVGLTLSGDGQAGRGQVVCPADAPASCGTRIEASVFWLSERPFSIDQKLRLRLATQQVACTVERIERLTDSSTLELLAENAQSMSAAQVGHVVLRCERPVAAEPFKKTPELGRFVLMRGHDAEAGGIVFAVGA